MKIYLKPLPFKFLLLLLLALVVIIVHSCRKDSRQPSSIALKSGIKVDIAELQKIYATSVNNNGSLRLNSNNGVLNLIHTLDVNWNTYTLQKRRDSSIVAEFDMNNDTGLFVLKPFKVGDTVKYINKTTATFIKYKNGSRLNFFTKIIEDLSAAGSHSVIQNLHYDEVPYGFNGLILYYSFDLSFINGYHYTNGAIDKTIGSLPTTYTGSPSINSLRTNTEATCDVYPIYQVSCTTVTTPTGTYNQGCTATVVGYDVECGGDSPPTSTGGVSGDSGGGSTPNPPPCTPNPSNTTATASVSNGRLIIDVAAPPTGGSGSTTPPPPCPTNPTTPVTTTTVSDKDPCQEKITVSNKAANATIEGQNSKIAGYIDTSPNEYGTSENLSAIGGSTYNNTQITTDGYTDQFTPTFSWDNTNGFTVGFSHDHPANNSPDPLDVFPMISNLSNSNLVASGSSNIQFYQTNVSSTVVTMSGNYIITVNNWTTLQSVYDSYTSQGSRAFLARFQTLAQNYQNTNPSASLIEAGEYALMQLFGNAINLYVANPGSTTYTPLIIASSGQVAKKQC